MRKGLKMQPAKLFVAPTAAAAVSEVAQFKTDQLTHNHKAQ